MNAPLIGEFEAMLNELESSQLEVALVPQRRFTNHGGMIRCAISKNATWYREFCARFASSRVRKNAAFDTRIKRRHTLAILCSLSRGIDVQSVYTATLLAIAQRRVARSNGIRPFRHAVAAGGAR